jgi:hypothetical protein
MKRRIQTRRRPIRTFDPRRELDVEQLAALGGVCLAWNDAEAMLDVLLCVCSMVPHAIWREFATRINGIEGKMAIIKAACQNRYGIRDGWLHESITNTLDTTSEYRKYRDAIIHSRIIDRLAGVGEMAIRRGDIQEVLLTTVALNGLYDHIHALKQELYSLITWFQAMTHFFALDDDDKVVQRIMADQMAARAAAMREGVPGVLGLGRGVSPDKRQIEQEAQFAFSRYHRALDMRRSLAPLPSFPKEFEVQQIMGDAQESRQ